MKKLILALCLISSSAFAGSLDRETTDLQKAVLGMDVCTHLGFQYRYEMEKCTSGVKNAIFNNLSGKDFVLSMCGGLKSEEPFAYSYCLEGIAQYSGQAVDLSVCDKDSPDAAWTFLRSKEARHAQCEETILVRSVR